MQPPLIMTRYEEIIGTKNRLAKFNNVFMNKAAAVYLTPADTDAPAAKDAAARQGSRTVEKSYICAIASTAVAKNDLDSATVRINICVHINKLTK